MSENKDNLSLNENSEASKEEVKGYDIFDLGEEDFFKESRMNAEKIAEQEDKTYSHNDETVSNVLPPYKREIEERTAEDATNITREKNSELYDTVKFTLDVEKDESLYKLPEMSEDIDELLKSFNIALDDENKKEESENSLDEEKAINTDETINFVLEKEEKEEQKLDFSRTHHFNLKGKNKADTQEDKKNFYKNFRVLSRNKPEDEILLEEEPEGEGRDSMMDTLKLKIGEDLFSAVEKAEKKKYKKSREERIKAINSGKATEEELKKSIKENKIRLFLLLGVFAVGLVSFILTYSFPSFQSTAEITLLPFALCNMLLLSAIGVLSKSTVHSGVLSVRYGTPDVDISLITIYAFTFISEIISLFSFKSTPLEYYKSYTVVVAFAFILKILSSFLKDKTNLMGMETLMEKEKISSAEFVLGKAQNLALTGENIKDKKARVIEFKNRGLETQKYEFSSFSVNDKSVVVLIASLILGVILGGFYAFKLKEPGGFFLSFLSLLGLGIPVLYDLSLSALGFIVNLKLKKKSSAAVNCDLIKDIGSCEAVALEFSDIFLGKVSRFKRVPGSEISRSDSVVFAYYALKKGGSVLADCFEEYVKALGVEGIEAEDFSYEDKLGFSCWIADRRVLIGNRQMLVEHSIPAPTEFEEKQYAGKKKVLYLVVEGEITATFIYSYRLIASVKRGMKDFFKTGLTLLLSAREPALSGENAAQSLGMPIASVRLLGSKGIEIVEKEREAETGEALIGVFTEKDSPEMLNLISACHKYYQNSKFLFAMYISAVALSGFFGIISVLLNMKIFFSPVFIIFYVLFFLFVSLFYCEKDFFMNIFSSEKPKAKTNKKAREAEKETPEKKVSEKKTKAQLDLIKKTFTDKAESLKEKGTFLKKKATERRKK